MLVTNNKKKRKQVYKNKINDKQSGYAKTLEDVLRITAVSLVCKLVFL